jgi:tetratricopeptide (TPR) repeat protein
LSQEELAERCGLSPHTISNLERNRTRWPYRDTLQRLADGLGLRDDARAAFTAGAGLRHGRPAGPFPAASASAGGRVVPRQLPAPVPGFAGRQHELKLLSDLLSRPGGTAVIAAVGGTAGVGKTALAVQWAHQVAAEFPDGQLFVNLRGFDPARTPVTHADAVLMLLEALDVPPDRLPVTVDAQLGLYRSLLAGKRMLLVLDNAYDEAQVRPLLPGSLTCRVVVTSRNQLAGLAAIEAAHPLLLDVLRDTEACELLEQRLGADRVFADPGAAEQVIRACASLPLALSIVAARAAIRPDLSLSHVAAALGTRPDLDAYAAGADPAADIRTVLSWSYQQLDAEAARAFRLAGLHPGQDLDRYAVAALTGMSLSRADRVLAALARGCLIQVAARDRFRMHDLLRLYARELAGTRDSKRDRREALTSLVDYYLRTAAEAVDTVEPAGHYHRSQIALPAGRVPAMPDKNAALTWLNTERPTLTAVAVYAADNGWPSHVTRLSAILYVYLGAGGYIAEALSVHGSAARAARLSGDHIAEASALTKLGSTYFRQGNYQSAAGHYEQAVAIYSQSPDRRGEARVVNELGLVNLQRGQLREATIYIERAIALFRELGDRANEANSLANIGIAEHRQGRYDRAMEHAQQALTVCREIGDVGTQAFVLTIIGTIHTRRGSCRRAAVVLQQALSLARQVGDRAAETDILCELGLSELRQGLSQQAAQTLQQALELAIDSGSLNHQVQALNNLGEAHLCEARTADARARYAAALELASRSGARREQARAHYGLGRSYHECGDTPNARRHWREALTLFTELGAPEADLIRTQLAAGKNQNTT